MQKQTPPQAERFATVALTAITASPTNPRKHFDDAYIDDLARSIKEKGLIQPLIVRPNGKANHFEIVAGECRFRASSRAGLAEVPVIIRDYTPEQVLEVQLIENIHRTDLTPLEQAAGYRALIDANPTKHSAATIAQRVGMSEQWVWDRLKLNDLIPEAKAILERELITIGHAIILARLTPDDQARAIKVERDRGGYDRRAGLWRNDNSFRFGEKTGDKYDGVKPCSVRELEQWVRNHVRFDVQHAAQAQPFMFEATAQQVEAAAAKPGRGKKVIAITHDFRVADDARDPNERTYGRDSWKRADGLHDSKTCEHSVLGVVTAGDGYGEAFDVCVARDRCRVHWLDVIKAKERAAQAPAPASTAKQHQDSWQEQQRRDDERRAREEARWKVFHPALKKAVAAKLGALKAVNGPLYAATLKAYKLPAQTKPADLPRILLIEAVTSTLTRGSWFEKDMIAWAKLLGVDVKKLEPGADAKTPAKAAAKKRR